MLSIVLYCFSPSIVFIIKRRTYIHFSNIVKTTPGERFLHSEWEMSSLRRKDSRGFQPSLPPGAAGGHVGGARATEPKSLTHPIWAALCAFSSWFLFFFPPLFVAVPPFEMNRCSLNSSPRDVLTIQQPAGIVIPVPLSWTWQVSWVTRS